jgi:hypothetical protein
MAETKPKAEEQQQEGEKDQDEPEPVVAPCGPDAKIHERIIAILAELPAIGKTTRNKQQDFMYRSHDDVLNALNPLMAKHGVFAVPTVLERVTDQRTTAQGKVLYEVNLHVQYEWFGPGGDSVKGSTWGEGTDSGDKSTNKAMTMAFKNMVAQTFAVSTAESYDTDGNTDEETTGRSSSGNRPPAQQRQQSARRDEQTGRVMLPKGWDEWQKRMTALGVPERDQVIWMRQANEHVATDAQFEHAKKLLVTLTDVDGVAFKENPRAIIQDAIEKVYGASIVGPEWRIGPTEDSFPLFEDWQQAQDGRARERADPPPATEPPPPAAPVDDDIPF